MWNSLPIATRLILTVAGAIGISKGVKHLSKKKLFISFAIEDKGIRSLLVGQSLNDSTPFEFIDMSVKVPWDNAWKTKCRKRIETCHGVVVLITGNTFNATGVHWEVKCAESLGLPIMVMYANKSGKPKRVPKSLKDYPMKKWSWPEITKFVEAL